ncbi:hypothetical protein GUJ93_ZPchr0008g11788 [Zizania palustris]|uniref:H(+)-exporting diphosphatase n=1 Tax=Zizania palustris TaxID=103762 RepID=A0A8J5RXY8_ZIZPA|nr:hypothetical protein GUJ93_ZPchr0008g11788 [Zizania palustris]
MLIFAVVIFLFLGSVEGFSTKSQPCTYSKDKYCKPALFNALFSTVAFLLGAITSLVSGFLGMKIATYANVRTTLEARKGVGKAFITAFRSGAVMGFLLASSGLVVLYIAINVFKLYYGDDWEGLLSLSLVMALVGLPWLSLEGLVEVSTLRLLMWVLILLARSKGTFLKMILGIQL